MKKSGCYSAIATAVFATVSASPLRCYATTKSVDSIQRTDSIDLLASIGFIQGQKQAGQTLEPLIKAGLPSRFARYNPKQSFVSEKRWIEKVDAWPTIIK